MPSFELQFADGFYVSQSSPLADKRRVNMYPVIPETDAATQRSLFGTSGIVEVADVLSGESRGALVFSTGVVYRVIGSSLFSVSESNITSNLGAITGTSDVSMDSNGINIAIIDPDGDGYFFTPTTGVLEKITSSVFLGFGQTTSVTFKDGFYAYTTDNLFYSGSAKTTNSGKDFNALDFADAEINPDQIMNGFNDHNQLYIQGTETTQVYKTIATSGFPFQLISGAIIPKGVWARGSVISFDNSFLFLGGGKNEKPAIYRALGSAFERISTKSIEYLMHGYSKDVISKTRAFAWSENGNYFAAFTFGDNTFVYDQTASKLSGNHEWHERQSGISMGRIFKPWRAAHGVEAFGNIQVADDRTGKIGNLDSDVFKEYGEVIEYLWSTKPFVEQGNKIFSKEIQLYMQVGFGNDDVEEPTIRMDYSDDGGNTFSYEIPESLGKKGEYKSKVKWKRMGGIPLSRMLRWRVTDPIRLAVYGLYGFSEGSERG